MCNVINRVCFVANTTIFSKMQIGYFRCITRKISIIMKKFKNYHNEGRNNTLNDKTDRKEFIYLMLEDL